MAADLSAFYKNSKGWNFGAALTTLGGGSNCGAGGGGASWMFTDNNLLAVAGKSVCVHQYFCGC